MPQNSFALSVNPKLWKASFKSTQDNTSHLDLPSILNISLSNGVAVFLLIILVFNNPKSTTGLLFLVPFLATSITGEVCVVLFFVRIPRKTDFAIYKFVHYRLVFFMNGEGLTKNGESSITSMSILILGHWPISSLKLKACLYSFIMFIRVSFSSDVRSELERSIYLSKISSSVMVL